MNNQPMLLPPIAPLVQLLVLPLYLLVAPLMAFSGLLGGLSMPSSSYSNEESWEIARGSDGRIIGITIHRLARG